jgi:drug/metabolite transporter (DMT)-like permease
VSESITSRVAGFASQIRGGLQAGAGAAKVDAMARDRLDPLAVLLMVVLCAFWGLNQVAIKVADGGISPVLQAGIRSAGAAALVAGWGAVRGIRLWRRDGTLVPGIVTALLFAGEFALLNGSMVFTGASRAVVFLYLAPFVVAVGGHWFLPSERLAPVHVLGLVSAFAGMALAFGDALRLPTDRELLGDGMAAAAALFWGATTVVMKGTSLTRVSPHKVLLYQLAGSAIVLPILSLALGERGLFAPSPLVLWALAYQTVGVAAISYLAWFWLIARYPVVKLAAFSFLTPLFGLIAGGVLLAEPITPALAAALLLVGAGIALVNRRHVPAGAALAAPAQEAD